MKRFAWILLALSACSQNQDAPPPPDGVEVLQRVNLTDFVDNANFVGVTVGPVSGDIALIDAMAGIFSIEGEVIASSDALIAEWDRRPFTDVADLGDGKYALTVQNDGLLHDTSSGETVVHFCYEPEFLEDSDFQITNSLAYDSERQTIVAQPQTFGDEGLSGAEVAEFNVNGGQPSGWHILDDAEFSAGGLAVDGETLLMAVDTTIYSYAFGDKEPTPLVNLATLGIERVEGMALTSEGHLLVVDGADQELVEIAGWR